jgi:hypothetical protein
MIRRAIVVLLSALVGSVLFLPGSAAAGGPKQDRFEQNSAWACESAADLPPNHCINVKGKGDTGVLLVFEPDPRGPQESISWNPKADSRPCPHDADADPDGTWWQVFPEGPYVCHHRP